VREERKREFFLISGCVRKGVHGAFSDKLPLKWRKSSKAVVELSVGRCLGVSPLFPKEKAWEGVPR